jgi:hypothetical protein
MKIHLFVILQFLFTSCMGQNQINMEKTLLSEYVSNVPNAKKLVLFGGDIGRRHEIIALLMPIGNLSVYGTLSESLGMEKIKELGHVDIILIGGRYSNQERERIRQFVHQNLPNAVVTEPGFTYPYSNAAIFDNVKALVGL